MLERTVTIVNKLGLHARAATRLAQLARSFNASVTLHQGERSASADSVLGLLLLQSSQGKQVTVRANGSDAEHAIMAICELIAARFEENE